jgi:hypothetical protein
MTLTSDNFGRETLEAGAVRWQRAAPWYAFVRTCDRTRPLSVLNAKKVQFLPLLLLIKF